MKKLSDERPNEITIVCDVGNNKTLVSSNYSPWDSLFVALEGVAMLSRTLINNGMSPEKVAKKVNSQLSQALFDYEITYKQKARKKNE